MSRWGYLWATLMILLISSAWLLIGLSSPPQFEFVEKLHGIRDTELERHLEGVTHSMGEVPLGEIEFRSYAFRATPDSVLSAMTRELLPQGWTRIVDPIGATFSKDGQVAMYDTAGLTEIEGATCSVTMSRRAGWTSKQWRALKGRLGVAE